MTRVLFVFNTSSQPLMSLLFGNLTNDFVRFSITLEETRKGNAAAAAALPAATANFKRVAANDASYLVYIGAYIYCLLKYLWLMLRSRYWNVRGHLHLHVRLGLHRRGQREADS